MRSVAYLNEPLLFTLNEDKIEVKGQTVSSSTDWSFFTKLMDREKYFLLLTTRRTFHYLPKDGFESSGEITRFKDLTIEKI